MRLFAAVLGSAGSVWFVVVYSTYSHIRFKFDHEGGNLMLVSHAFLDHGNWLFLLPVLALPIGFWLVRSRPQATVTFEILLSVIWLLSLALAAFCLLMWQVQNIPIFSHMEWHY
ncbi:MAG: hypothetical protein NTX87_03305 [Planctomycetota bacterium]|nr:hypothetical protein [Planctomycetota bacterium]